MSAPGPPRQPPIGAALTRAARAAAQAFDREMAQAGGSASLWQVLLLVRSRQWGAQSELAAALGITPATLTHHLATAERQGLVRRWREPGNRRVQRVELTERGDELFVRLRGVAQSFDARLREALGDDTERLAELLERVELAVGGELSARPA